MNRINTLVKRHTGLSKTTPNFIIYEKDLYRLKNIYDLQLESLCKNLLYLANDKGRIKNIFKIKLIQEQNRIWTAGCIGNLKVNISKVRIHGLLMRLIY
jgi:hypothetical protein